jgi:hypothetical protein
VITLPIDAFFHSIQNWPNNATSSKPEAFRPSSSTSAHQASKTESKESTDRNGVKRARWQGLLKQSIQDLQIAAVQNLRKLIAAMHNALEELARYGVLNRAVLHFPFSRTPSATKILYTSLA